MLREPDGAQRPDDVVSNAVAVGQIATGERDNPPALCGTKKPTASPEAQEKIAAITTELAAAGVTIRWC